MFHTYFPTISAETLHLLCKAGYIYYNAVLCLDALVDEGDTKALVEMLALQGETIKILTSIYGYKSPFWELWQQLFILPMLLMYGDSRNGNGW